MDRWNRLIKEAVDSSQIAPGHAVADIVDNLVERVVNSHATNPVNNIHLLLRFTKMDKSDD